VVDPSPIIEVRGLTFRYRKGDRVVLDAVDLTVGPGTRSLVIGANGAGKSTLLRVIAGKHMIPPEVVTVLGWPAFHDPRVSSAVELLGGRFPFEVDLTVEEILARHVDVDPVRRARLIDVLGVDVQWHMHAVSDGQRRRVQLLLGLMRPRKVLLLDEVTTDLDLLARQDLLAFLAEESTERGTTILYATHILDRLDRWATHLIFMVGGKVTVAAPLAAIPELTETRAHSSEPLLVVIERWLRRDRGY
jgi:CCR4-NOT complex subunit CAF16